MKPLVSFARAIVRNSIYFLTSSFAAALLTVYEHLRGSSLTAGLFLVLTIGLLMAACYRAWLEERQRAAALESELSNTRRDLEAERARKPFEEAQAKLLDAQREEMEVQKRVRETEKEHDERMKFLTAPDRGIRLFVADQTTGENSTFAFTADMLAESLFASKTEIEEALRILESQGFAKETKLPGHWFIRP